MAYSSISKPSLHFNTKLYTGNGGTQTISGIGHQPDLIWGKNRASNRHFLADSVRGKKTTGYYLLCTNNTEADTSNSASDGITSINSDGFVLGANASNTDGGWSYELNGNARNFVSWNWKANGQGSSNTDGSINTTYTSVNTTAGFSICKYTGTGSNATVGHGLGVAPKMIIVKQLNSTNYWTVYHKSLSANSWLYLDTTEAVASNTAMWNNTEPTSSVFSIGTYTNTNQSSSTYVAYCFAEKTGYSKFGSYVGNGNADGTFIYTGFKPAFILLKHTTSAESWHLFDGKRANLFNPVNGRLQADSSGAEYTGKNVFDFLSNGFKLKDNNGAYNGSGSTYIYMAFAEAPLVGTNNVPCTAR